MGTKQWAIEGANSSSYGRTDCAQVELDKLHAPPELDKQSLTRCQINNNKERIEIPYEIDTTVAWFRPGDGAPFGWSACEGVSILGLQTSPPADKTRFLLATGHLPAIEAVFASATEGAHGQERHFTDKISYTQEVS